jgi:Fur family transcriptional regulator, ferric uptake regulator
MSELVSAAAQALRDRGGRMTVQRRTILETLETLGGHPTAEDIYRAASQRDRSINPSTVYRTLNWLADAGLLSPAWLGPERSRRQEPVVSDCPEHHHHFVCARCGHVIEFAAPDLAALKQSFAAEYGVEVERATLTLYGLCAACKTASREE